MATHQTLNRYRKLADKHNEMEIAAMMGVSPRTVRRYALQAGKKPEGNDCRNRTPEEWVAHFNELYNGRMIANDPESGPNGHVTALTECLTCHTRLRVKIGDKIRTQTGCTHCDQGRHGNALSASEVEARLNERHTGQWTLLSYGKYSQTDSVIQCNLCNTKATVNLSDFINTTTRRCAMCQTGSFGEYVIRHILRFNEIPFEKEKHLNLDGRRLRLDFLIDDRYALECSGEQHFEEGRYFNARINDGVELKRQWAATQGYTFCEMRAQPTPETIQAKLEELLRIPLKTPSADFYAKSDENMNVILGYLRTHSSRQTSRDLGVSITKIRRCVQLAGYSSISAWQAEN